MRTFIYTGGSVDVSGITEHPRPDDLCIAADAGYRTAQALGERVDILLGDFDSLGEPPSSDGFELMRVPTEKDLTDTQLAVEVALDRGADDIILVGGLSGRLDHTLSTLAVLEDLYDRGIPALITDGQSRVRFLRSSSTLIARSHYTYLGIVAVDETVKGVEIKGCKYPLERATLRRSLQFAVSNEITGNVALISVRKGAVYIIESRDMR